MRALAFAASILLVAAGGMQPVDFKTVKLRLCSGTGECSSSGTGTTAVEAPTYSGTCLLPATIPCVVGE